ncbi:MAG: galactokinase family protein [Clostridia bacterium]|nr:galactokinase family protein [Clostridia bacterium]
MMQPNEWIAALEQPKAMLALTSLYSVEDSLAHAARYEGLAREYERRFGPGDMRFFRAPGRTELIGNHTDHNNGMALAAAVTADIVAVAAPGAICALRCFRAGMKNPLYWI